MIFEYRIYEVAPGRMQDLHERFKNHTIKIFEKHGITPVAFFTSEIGGYSDQLTYILSFNNHEHREKCWKNFFADTEWQKVKKDSEAAGPLVLRLKNTIFNPTEYSPIK